MRYRLGRKKQSGSLALVGVVALVSFLLAAPPPSEAGRGKPDLVPGSADQRGRPFAFQGYRQRVKVEYVIKNVGRGNARTVTSTVYFVGGGGRIQGESDTIIGRIKPGERAMGTLRQETTRRIPAGAYRLELCVDEPDTEEESDERNNCEMINGSRFYSSYAKWKGTLSGAAPFAGGANRFWQTTPANPAHYTFDKYEGGGVFSWKLVGGAIRHRTAGGDSCSYNGEGTFALATAGPGAGRITINHQSGSYSAGAAALLGATYNILVDCSGTQFNLPAIVNIPPALAVARAEFPFGATNLNTTQDQSAWGQGYTWNLVGQEPEP